MFGPLFLPITHLPLDNPWVDPAATLGQDLLARMIYGGRISLAVGVAAMLVATVVGLTVGSLAGMSRGALGPLLMWVTDLFLALPQLPLLLLLIYLFRDALKRVFGVEGGVFVMIVLVIGGAPRRTGVDEASVDAVRRLVAAGARARVAAGVVSELTGAPANALYKAVLAEK